MPSVLPRILLLFLLPLNLISQLTESPRVVKPASAAGLRFTENLGQWDEKILYRAQLDGGAVYLEKDRLTYSFYDKVKYRKLHAGKADPNDKNPFEIRFHCYQVKFLSSAGIQNAEKNDAGQDYENFYLGNDPARWRSLVRNYRCLQKKDLYPGINYELSAGATSLKYTFYVKSNADPGQIRLQFEGAENLKIREGNLAIQLSFSEVVEQKPFAFQLSGEDTLVVPCKYKLDDRTVSFVFPAGYDKSKELVIDPTLIFAAQSGSSADNFGMTATYDAQGNLYAGGTVFGNGYPTTIGAYSINYNAASSPGTTDLAITKYNSSGTSLIYSTYLGGAQAEIVTSMIVDASNNLFLYGATGSADFPTTSGAYDQSFNGGSFLSFQFNGTTFNNGTDIFVSCFNAGGSALLASTFIGGSANDGVNHNNFAPPTHLVFPCFAPQGVFLTNEFPADSLQYNYGDQYRGEIQLDKNGDVYVASSSRSSDFPVVNAFQNSLNGKQDAVVFKFNPGLNTLLYSSYLGGSGNDAGYALIVDDSLQVFITGGTYSSNFPVVSGCYQTSAGGGKADGFLAKITATGNQIKKATYIGTASYDQSYFVQSDRIGRIYIFGQSLGNMPVSPGVYSNPGSKQFIMRFDNQLTNLNLSTVIGSGQSSLDISPSAFSVDKCSGSISLTGWGGNFVVCSSIAGMPVTPGAFQSVPPNGHDFYLMVLHPNASGLKYGSYFGGNLADEHVDGGTSRINEQGVLYQSVCAGCNGHDDFPVTPGSWPNTPGNPNHSTNCNNGVFKFDYDPQVTAAIVSNTLSGCSPATFTFSNNSSPGLPYMWNLGGGQNDTTTQISQPVKTFTAPGTYTVQLTVYENQYCFTTASTQVVVIVHPNPVLSFSLNSTPCASTVQTVNSSSNTPVISNHIWNFGDGTGTVSAVSPAHTYTGSGIYNVFLTGITSQGCSAGQSQSLAILVFTPAIGPGANICNGRTATLSAFGGNSYTWSPSLTLSQPFSPITLASPSISTVYSVVVQNSGFGITCAADFTTQVLVRPSPTTAFVFTTNPCGGGVQFTDQSLEDIVSWSWTLSSTGTSTMQNPYYFYPIGGTYTVSLVSTNSSGCQSKHDRLVQVGQPADVSVTGDGAICRGTPVQLTASGGLSYSWSPASSLDMPLSSNPIANPIVSTEYSVLITTSIVVNGQPCQYLLTAFVRVDVLSVVPVSAFADPGVILKGENSTLIYTGSPGANVAWYPFNSTSPATGYTVTATPPAPQIYTVVATLGACVQEVTVFVDVYSFSCLGTDLFIPNTFTPNGDGANDKLFVRGLKVEDFHFAVYNRWGEKVFETNDRSVGWDGVYKGKAADAGVFGWYLEAKCPGGEETFLKGNVTLIR